MFDILGSCCDVQIFSLSRNPMTQMEEEKREHVLKMKKMEAEMEQVFEAKVKEKLQKLKDSEADVRCAFCSPLCLVTFLILSSSDACSVEGKMERGRLIAPASLI